MQFEPFDTAARVEADINGVSSDSLFGISFAPDIENAGSLTYLFNVKENRIEFYNIPELFDSDPQSFMDFNFKEGEPLHISLLISDGVASLYVNNEIALTARMYQSQGMNWQFFSIKSAVSVDNVQFFN